MDPALPLSVLYSSQCCRQGSGSETYGSKIIVRPGQTYKVKNFVRRKTRSYELATQITPILEGDIKAGAGVHLTA